MKILLYVLSALVLPHGTIAAQRYCLPTEACWPSKLEIEGFKIEVNQTGGRVQTPDEGDWPAIGLTFNLAVGKQPALIVYVTDVNNMKKALAFAKIHNIRLSIISSGHSFPGRCTAEDSMQISVHYMKDIDVDLKCKEHHLGCIKTQTGVQWGEAYREASKYKRLVVGGSNPTVSVSGWTLGGGHSPVSRMFGLGVDNVISFHLITSDLSEVWTSAAATKIIKVDGSVMENNDTSLFWALRGGGSAFGLIVDITFRLHMDNHISQLVCIYNAYQDGTGKTFRVMYDSLGPLLTSAPNTFSGYIIPSVGCDPMSGACGGTSLVSILHYGSDKNSTDAGWLKKFRDLPHQWTAAGVTDGRCYVNEYDTFYEYELSIPNTTYVAQYLGGSLIQEDLLSGSFTDTLIRHFDKAYARAKQDPSYNLIGTAIWVGGAVKNVPVNSVPVHAGWRNAIFTLSSATLWDIRYVKIPPADQIQAVRDVHKDLSRFSNGKYYNEAEPDLTPDQWKKEFFGAYIYEKLFRIKQEWDPENLFTCVECVGSDWDPTIDKDTVVG